MKFLIFTLLFQTGYAETLKNKDLYLKVFKDFSKLRVHKIEDTISEFKTNVNLFEVLDKGEKRIGFIREISTSTGCNDGCLPVIFTLFYSSSGKFLRLISKPGLTKKDHEEYEEIDYIHLDSILRRNPPSFKKIKKPKHPKEMVDALTGATLKAYKHDVISRSAYTTLRANLYNQDTLKFIRENYILPKKK